MGLFNETLAHVSAGRSVNASLLTYMNFRDDPVRWWLGYGDLVAGGHTWIGMGRRNGGALVQIEGLDAPIGTVAPQTTFTLSGVDPRAISIARASSDKAKGRRVIVYIQFFGSATTPSSELWAPMDKPNAIWTGEMDQVRYGADAAGAQVTVTAETIWANRNRPPFGLYTDPDQKARFPGDRGLEQVASLVTKTIRWPEF